MYEITFQGITPNKMFNRISVVGNNNADIISFIVPIQQTSISLAGMTAYIKVQSKSGLYLNKERLESVEDATNIVSTWTLTDEYTQYKELECQLQFQDNDSNVVWQSEIFYLTLSSTIRTDAYISNKYPTVLNQLENDVQSIKDDIENIDSDISNLDEKKLDKVTSTVAPYYDGRVYGIDNDGNQMLFYLGFGTPSASKGGIPVYSVGHTLPVGTPITPTDATPRSYVDANKGTKLYKHIVTVGIEATFSVELMIISTKSISYTLADFAQTEGQNGLRVPVSALAMGYTNLDEPSPYRNCDEAIISDTDENGLEVFFSFGGTEIADYSDSELTTESIDTFSDSVTEL